MIKKITFAFLILFFSCNDSENEILITILNDNLRAYIPKDTLDMRILIDKNSYIEKSNNVIKYKIENKSDKTFVFFEKTYSDYYIDDIFGLKFYNVLITNEEKSKVQIGNAMTSPSEDFLKYNEYNLRLENEKYKNLGYLNKSEYWVHKNFSISNNMITLHPNETLYFETYIRLPNAYNDITNNYDSVIFDFSKNYFFSLYFNFNSYEDIKDYLTELQKQAIKENNYEIFEGELKSVNQVPIKFVE